MENNYECNASKLLEEYEGLYINDPIGALKKIIFVEVWYYVVKENILMKQLLIF